MVSIRDPQVVWRLFWLSPLTNVQIRLDVACAGCSINKTWVCVPKSRVLIKSKEKNVTKHV